MDCKINRLNSEGKIESQDVGVLLDFSWKDSGIWEQINSFREWFGELDEAIADLREKIMERGRK
jgi:hypothetical protein